MLILTFVRDLAIVKRTRVQNFDDTLEAVIEFQTVSVHAVLTIALRLTMAQENDMKHDKVT